MSDSDKLSLVSRLLAEGKGDRLIAAAIDGTRHDARKLIEQVRLAHAGQNIVPASGGALALYETACRALAQACTVDEAKDIRDKAEAIRVYARQAKNRTLEADAAVIRIRAERRFGEIEAELKAAGQMHRGGRPRKTGDELEPVSVVTLDDLGVDKKFSSRTQKLAAVPVDEFEARLSELHTRIQEESARVSLDLLRAGEREQRKAEYRADIAAGCTVDDLRALAASGAQFPAIYADPPWKFLTRSPRGEGRSASEHYATRTIESICALPVAQLAAKDAVLFLWTVDWDADLTMARALMSAWGFEHKTTAFTWAKLNPSGEGFHMGQGYWTRANPETCLLATRGNPKRLNADVRQLMVSPVMEHSRKPDEIHERIERLVAGPYLELYGRRPRDNWTVWGDQISREDFGGAPVEHLAQKHLHRALALVAARCGEPRPRDVYLISAGLAPYVEPADAALDALTREQFDLICSLDDPKACSLALTSAALESAFQILSEFAATFPDPAQAAE